MPACLPYWLPIPESDRSSHCIPNFAGNPTFTTERRPKGRRPPNEGSWEAPRRLTRHRRLRVWTRSVPLWIESWIMFFRRYKGGGATHRRRLRLPCCPYPPQHQHPPAPAVTHRHPPTPAHQNLPCTALRCTKPDTLRRHRAVGRHWPKTRTSGKKMPLKKPRCNKPTSFHSVSRPLLPSAVVPCQGLRA